MSRRIKLKTKELGDLHLMLIFSTGGVWEPAWAALKDHPYAEYLTRTSTEVVHHALHGWTLPLVRALGPSPAIALHKLSPDAKQCDLWDHCIFYDKRHCLPNARKMPHCFQPRGLSPDLGYLVISLWRESVYIVVEETP